MRKVLAVIVGILSYWVSIYVAIWVVEILANLIEFLIIFEVNGVSIRVFLFSWFTGMASVFAFNLINNEDDTHARFVFYGMLAILSILVGMYFFNRTGYYSWLFHPVIVGVIMFSDAN